jgi:SAM-dependent methyltransferase
MSEERRSADWQDVDSITEPQSKTEYLDHVRALQGSEGRRQRTYDLLHVQPGFQLLDVGCGAGDDVRALAQMVGDQGRVVGIDPSETLIAEAQQRSENASLSVDFQVGDVTQLTFADNTFDGCCASRVFIHLSNREQALAEMIRVSRPGAWIVVAEPDWETLLIDAPNMQLTRQFVAYYSSRIQNAWCGRQLLRLAKDAGLAEIICDPVTAVFTDYAAVNKVFRIQEFMEDLVTAGQTSQDSVSTWLSAVEHQAQRDRFFCSLTLFIVAGRKRHK